MIIVNFQHFVVPSALFVAGRKAVGQTIFNFDLSNNVMSGRAHFINKVGDIKR